MSNESPEPTDEELPSAPARTDETAAGIPGPDLARANAIIEESLVGLGYIAFDEGSADNTTSDAMVSAERRRHFQRDLYVGIHDEEQGRDFLGRIVEGPFHAPHEVAIDSAITRTTLLHPDRTGFRPTYYVHGAIEVLGEIRAGERIIPTATRPRPYSEIYVFPSDRLRVMLGITGDFYLGQLMGYDDVDVHIDGGSKGFLPRNVGVFGTIGSGKSNTVQVVMEQALDAGWAVVVVDVEGEYVRMDEPTDDVALSDLLRRQFHDSARGVPDLRVYVPSSGSTEAVAPVQFKVPIAALETEILTDLLELSEPQARMFGTITANARRTTAATPSATRLGPLASSQGAPATRPFTLQTLIDGLDDSTTPPYTLAPNIQQFERPTASVLRSKLINLGRSGVLDWGATSRVAELPVNDLLVGGRLSILDVSETDDRSRSLAIAYLLQSIFQRVVETPVGQPMTGGQIRPRVLVVIEEVHTFVSRANAQRMRAVIDQLQVISRRGRKRWMALALVSQQPGHVPDELFELANTRFIHQLKSAANLAPVQQTTGGVHEALWKIVPTMGQGQALVTGSMLRNPIFINMRPARSRRLLTA